MFNLCLPLVPVCRPMYLLGYLASQSKVYLMDKDFSVRGWLAC